MSLSPPLIAAIKSLLVDIESMQARLPNFPDDFGPFSQYEIDDEDGATIEWPNLAICADQVKQLLKQEGLL